MDLGVGRSRDRTYTPSPAYDPRSGWDVYEVNGAET